MIYTDDIIAYQWAIFLKALNLGILLGGCYDFFRVIRIVFRLDTKLRIAFDFIYCLWAGFLTFSFLLNENFGFLRLYIIITAAMGFLAWYFTFGKIIAKSAVLLRKVLRFVLSPFAALWRIIRKFAEKRLSKTKINLLNFAARTKSLLKKHVTIVYNILCLNVSKAFSFCGGKAGKEPERIESKGTQRTEEGTSAQNRGRCIRDLSSLFPDINAGPDQ
ncbi:MAG: spore cortex biosynthesis protein YabQ [Oscillospiraceae bacterium]|nr:spore cortex biosynthesis protein YabQ [Oscillospiraceae bacterium]